MYSKEIFNINRMDSFRCWKHLFEILVHGDIIASHNSCRIFRCTFLHKYSILLHPNGDLLDSNPVSGKVTEKRRRIHYHAHKTSLRRLLLCAGIRHQKVNCAHEGMDMVSNSIQIHCGIQATTAINEPKLWQDNILHSITLYTTFINLESHQAGWIRGFMLLTPNSDLTLS